MRTLAITQNITVDGSIELLGNWFDAQAGGQADMSDLMEESHRQDSEADALLVGRRTFEDFRAYWPAQTDDPTGITDYLNGFDKYVVCSTLSDPAWRHHGSLGRPRAGGGRLKQADGKDIVLTGSIRLAHAMIEARFVDEYRLFVYPVVQGRGRRLFPDGYEIAQLRPLDLKRFRSGVTLLRYAAA